jgi:hypothetical protein
MKKKILIILTLIIILSTFVFAGCSSKKTNTINQSKREIESITYYYRADIDANTLTYNLSSAEIEEAKKLFDNVGELERKILNTDKEQEYYKYTLKITLKKKFLKKAKTYYVYVDYNYLGTNIFTKDPQWYSNEDRVDMSIDDTKYKGTATPEFTTFLENLIEKAQ